jgi:hypothetical protein
MRGARAANFCLVATRALSGSKRARPHAAAPAPAGRDAGDNGQQGLTHPSAIDAVLVGKHWFC